MSLGVVFKGPEGLVLAADSRVTLTAVSQAATAPLEGLAGMPAGVVETHHTYFDNATKLLRLQSHPNLGIVTYGQGAIGQAQPRMAHGFIPEFEAHLEEQKSENGDALSVEATANALGSFFSQQWTDAGMSDDTEPMVFLVAGFDEDAAYGRVFEVSVPNAPGPVEQMANDFGVEWGGMTYFAERLINGVAPMAIHHAKNELDLSDEQAEALARRWHSELELTIPYQFLPLQDCVDFTTFLVDMTASVISWTVGNQGVGGHIDVATITRTDGFQSVQQKRIHAWE
jgi:hypothetical protein